MSSLPFTIQTNARNRVRYIVKYQLGNPDREIIRNCLAETYAISAKQAINNVRYRTGNNPTFLPISCNRR